LEVSPVSKIITIIIQIGKKYWDLETCRKNLEKCFDRKDRFGNPARYSTRGPTYLIMYVYYRLTSG
jgi:hypothetical protein